MNAPFPSLSVRADASGTLVPPPVMFVRIFHAANLLVPDLAGGRRITSVALRSAMETACDGSDAEGAWVWRDAYEACEAAQVLFLRKYGPAMHRQATTPAAFLAMLARLASLFPTQTRRSEDSQTFQQFSTPIELGFVAAHAAGIVTGDHVLEPSAGTGLLAIFAERGAVSMTLNELANARAELLAELFPAVAVKRHDSAQTDDSLDYGICPTIVLMNLPFSVAAHVDGKMRDAAWRHLSSAFARLADGARLVAITGAGLSPYVLSWREAFVKLQERGRVGRVNAAHGTLEAQSRGRAIRSRAALSVFGIRVIVIEPYGGCHRVGRRPLPRQSGWCSYPERPTPYRRLGASALVIPPIPATAFDRGHACRGYCPAHFACSSEKARVNWRPLIEEMSACG
jgi:hypothetical protein